MLHISVFMPLRWLSGNCGDLYQHNFAVSDIASAVEIIDKALYEVLIDGEKLIDEDFMMDIFYGITKKLPPLQEHLDFMFSTKKFNLVGSRKEEGNVFRRIYCGLNCFILLAKIFLILTNFVLNSHVKQRQYSELSSGTSARPHLSTYLQLVGRRS